MRNSLICISIIICAFVNVGIGKPKNTKTGDVNICYDSSIPAGWVKITDFWDPTKCGNPTSHSNNVFQIRDVSDFPKGSTQDVCYDSPIPAGWVVKNKKWDPTKCGSPKSYSNNIYTIEKAK